MIVGFTGTRQGMTDPQKKAVKVLLLRYKPKLVVHGGCVGADDHFDTIAWVLRIRRTCYPGAVPLWLKAKPIAPYEECRIPRPPLMRNRLIVNEADVILATPAQAEEVIRSGTWATIRYARLMCQANRCSLHIIYPDGSSDNTETSS